MENITLRNWTVKDSYCLVDFINSVNRNYISNRIPNPYTIQDAILWIDNILLLNNKGAIFKAIEINNEIIGSISVEKKKDISIYDSEIGYMISTKYWNQGIATRAVEQICQEAFELLNVTRITGYVYHPNIASQRVLQKNNFVLEGKMKSAVYKNKHFYDMLIYAKYNQ